MDDNGEKHGPWEVKYPESGKTRYQGQFEHGQPVGAFFYYYENGQKSAEVQHHGDGTSTARFLHKNGTVMGEGKYKGQQKHGEWKFYDNRTILSSVDQYDNGVLHGVRKVYHLNGQIAAEVPFENGVENGPFKEYSADGTLLKEGTYADGTYDGEYKQYYDGGQLLLKGQYRAAVKDGHWVEYDEDGRIMVQRVYKDGELEKEQIEPGYKRQKHERDLDPEDVIDERELQEEWYNSGRIPR